MKIEIPTDKITQRPTFVLELIFLIHLLLLSLSLLGYWSNNRLLAHGFFFLITLLWSINSTESISPVLLALGIDCFSIIIDVIILAISYPHDGKSYEQFSAVMAIFNLICRFVSTPLLFSELKSRMGITTTSSTLNTTIGNNNSTGIYGFTGSQQQYEVKMPKRPSSVSSSSNIPPPTYIQHQ